MKTKITMQSVKAQYPTIIKIGYCNLQDLLCVERPVYYTCGAYGWNSDIYTIAPGVAICTGYLPFGNVKPDFDVIRKYEKRAHEMRRDLWNAEELAEYLHSLQMEFIREVCNV